MVWIVSLLTNQRMKSILFLLANKHTLKPLSRLAKTHYTRCLWISPTPKSVNLSSYLFGRRCHFSYPRSLEKMYKIIPSPDWVQSNWNFLQSKDLLLYLWPNTTLFWEISRKQSLYPTDLKNTDILWEQICCQYVFISNPLSYANFVLLQ